VLLREGTTATLVEALQKGELDLVVGRAWTDFAGGGLRFEPFYSEPMRVIARSGHPLARRGPLKLEQLTEWPWILPPPETAFRKRLEAAFRQAGVEPPLSIVESMSILTNTMLVQETDTLCVLPRDLAQHYARAGGVRVLGVKLPAPSGPVGVITAAGRALPPAASDLVQALRDTARELTATSR
jgi:DNA-binding transcriptional LysR family regulator